MRTALLAVIKKEVRQAFRDPRMAMVLMVAPVLQLTLLGFAVDLDVEHVATVVVDRDQTEESRSLIRGLFADGTLIRVADADEPEASIQTGLAKVVVVVPSGLARHLLAGTSAEIQILVDGSDPIVARTAVNVAELYFRSAGLRALRARLASAPVPMAAAGTVQGKPRIFYNPRLKSTQYMVPGVAATVLLIVTTIVTAMGIARERELGTIEQLLVTPMQPSTLLLGKTLPFAIIGLVVAGLVISVGTNLFGVPIRGSLFALFLCTLAYLMCTLGMGIFISTIASNQQQAILGGFFFLMPAILLSGFMSPIEAMPAWIRAVTWINPVRHFVAILRAVLLKGATLEDLWLPFGILLAFGISILTLASVRFHKRLA
ncbi:MAG: ABC transporter permease [Myxococcota bacterium]